MSALLAAAAVYGSAAVAWVTANSAWLIPLGPVAYWWLEKLFG